MGSLDSHPDFAQDFSGGDLALLGLFQVAGVNALPWSLRGHIHLNSLSHWPNKIRALPLRSLALLDCTFVSIP